jgi:hypothetical protein
MIVNRKRKLSRILILLTILILPIITSSQVFHRKINRIDEKGNRQGRWITWQDSVRRIPSCKSWFRDGKEYRTTRYYHNNGKCRLSFSFQGDSVIVVRYFDEKGRLTEKGRALRLYTPTEIRFCWDGEWKQYDRWHRVIGRQQYKKGEEVSVSSSIE